MKNTIVANTFTPRYDALEDRLRLVVNYQDIQNRVDFMITRSFILNIIPAAEEFIAKHYVQNTNINTGIEYTQNKASTPTDNVNLELYRTEEELLREVNFSFDEKTKFTTVSFTSKNFCAKAALDAFLLSQVFDILKSAIPNIKWGISHHF